MERVRGGVNLQGLGQALVPLQSGALLVAFQPEGQKRPGQPVDGSAGLLANRRHLVPASFELLLGEQRADVQGVARLHVRQLAGHSDGRVPATSKTFNDRFLRSAVK